MTLEFPIQLKERHFFGGIPDRGNKYYIPSNRNSQSTQQKFGEQGIPKTFDTLMSKNYKFCVFSCSPENDDFWHFLYSKDTPGTRFLSSFILHRPVCQNRRAHDIIRFQKWCDQNLRSILKSQNLDLKFRSKRMPCKRVPATVTVRSARPVTVAVAGPHLLHRLCNFRNLTGPRCLCQIFVALGGSRPW